MPLGSPAGVLGGVLETQASIHKAYHQNYPHSCRLPARCWGPGTLSQVWASPGCGSQPVPALAPSPSIPASCCLPGLSREAPDS